MGHYTVDAEQAAFDAQSHRATQAGAYAFSRLLKLAEERNSGQIQRIARFLAACYNGDAFPSCSSEHDWNCANTTLMRTRV
jgi:hypothetical protein